MLNIKEIKIIMKYNIGVVIWLTGLPCSGKTTLAIEIEKYFKYKNKSI